MMLHFRCPVSEAVILDIFREVTAAMSNRKEPPSFSRTRRQALPDASGAGASKEEVWTAGEALIEIKVHDLKSKGREESGYFISYTLTMDTGFHLKLEDRAPTPFPQEVRARMHRVWPQKFDELREIFRKHLKEESDFTDGPWAAAQNAQAAFDAGYGAFARHLIDQAMERRQARADLRAQEDESEWWLQLEALSKRVTEGPEEH